MDAGPDPIYRELVRIFGDDPAGTGQFLLPLVDEADALAFLRTVPAGADFRDLPALAAAYRDAHPLAQPDVEVEDHDAAG